MMLTLLSPVPVLLGEMIGRELAGRLGVRGDSVDAKRSIRARL